MTDLIFTVLLTTLPQESDLDRLVHCMGAEEYDVRDAAMGSLYRHGKKAVPVLRRALRSKDPEIAARARFMLGVLQALEKIRPGSFLDVVVAGEPELSRTIFVSPDGSGYLPYIGRVEMAGRTADELRAELERRYRKLIKKPQVQVIIRRRKVCFPHSLTWER